ncbi:MAG: alpha/beta hydrolase [Actinobacteria bacterium]|nr:alpha/beta hydrolase [Actinomycetota bacterium]
MTVVLTQESTSRFAQTPSWRIHYNEAGAGSPVIMLHGSGPGATGWSNFNRNIGALAERHRVLAVDMPGWGQSDGVTFEERDHVGATLQLMDTLGIEKAAFVGNSMGGMTALRFAIQYPDRISHLVTMGPGAPGVKLFGFGDGPSEGLKILNRGYRDPSPQTLRELVEIMTFDSSFVTEDLIHQRAQAAQARPDHLENFIGGIGKPLPVTTEADLAGIQVPTLLIHGRDDRVVHYENSLKLVALIPNSRLVLLNRCGHWAQLEHADEFNQILDQFLVHH